MESAQKLLIVTGLDRLYYEIVATAMTNHGWHVLDFKDRHVQSGGIADVALVFSLGAVETVLNAVHRVCAEWPGIKVVLLSLESPDSDVIRFIEAGVSACVGSSQSLMELVSTLQMVGNDQVPASGRVTQLVLNDISRLTRQRDTNPESRLTSREAEILSLVGTGLSNKEIAAHLNIAPNTVKNHVHHLLEKLRVRSRHEASWLQSHAPRGFPLAG